MARRPSGAPDQNDDELTSQNASNDEGTGNPSSVSDDEDQEEPEPDTGSTISEAELDALDELERKLQMRADEDTQTSIDKIIRLAASYPSTTPDTHTIGGYGGVALHVGDLRRVGVFLRNVTLQIAAHDEVQAESE